MEDLPKGWEGYKRVNAKPPTKPLRLRQGPSNHSLRLRQDNRTTSPTMSSFKAIPTDYQGMNFRSRLEADWAATFDFWEVRWEYEPEGFVLTNGEWYSPDFWLPDCKAWFEVKGSHNMGIDLVRQFEQDLWGETYATVRADPNAPLVLIGREPHWDENRRHLVARYQGVYYSALFARCLVTDRLCARRTVVVPGQEICRNCGGQVGGRTRSWIDAHGWFFSEYENEFKRLPRPAGRRNAQG